MNTQELEQLIRRLRVTGTVGLDVEVRVGVGKQVVETLSAMSNSCGGTLIVGLSVRDGFEPVPGFAAERARDKLLSRCEQLTPTVRAQAEVHTLTNGASVLVAEVPEMFPRDKPCYVQKRGLYDGSFQRAADSNVPLLAYDIDHYVAEQSQPTWDEEPIPGASLDEAMLRPFVNRQERLRPDLFAAGTAQALESLGVVNNGTPTLAAMLTMGANPQNHYPQLTVTVGIYAGPSERDYTDGVVLSGTISELIDQAVDMVRRHAPEYPSAVIREAVTNALLHRDYSPLARAYPVQVRVFTDRLEVTNPGALYGAITTRELGEEGLNPTRNRRLVELVGPTVAKGSGLGFAAMQRLLADVAFPVPEVRTTATSLTLVLPRHQVGAAPNPKALTARDQVLQLFDARDTISAAEATAVTGLSRSAVQKALAQLVSTGVLEPTEAGRSPKQRYRQV